METPSFIHLKVKSAYSLLDGAMTVKKIANIAKERSMPAIGICDSNLFGALEFSETISSNGIQPIIGLSLSTYLDIEDQNKANICGKITLIAQTEIGLQNLMLLSSASFVEAGIENNYSLPIETIIKHSEGLICLTGGWQSPINNAISNGKTNIVSLWIDTLFGCFKDRFYIELQRLGTYNEVLIEEELIRIAYEKNIPLVATNDVRFDKRSRFYSHEILRCIDQSVTISNPNREKLTEEFYLKTSEEMLNLFTDLPEAIENTIEIAKRCHIKATKRNPILPSFASSNGLSEDEELNVQAKEGLKERLQTRPPVAEIKVYEDRLDFELAIINKMGFAGYFLIVSDFIKWAKDHDIPVGPGRGSGAGSLVAYSLKITDLDPLEFGLLFERFLNPERISMPDFDIDFCQDRREEVIAYVQNKYGFEQVSQIITFGTLQPRAAVRDVGRVLGLSFGKVSDITKLIPNNPANPVSLSKALTEEPKLAELKENDDEVNNVIDVALDLEGLYRNASTHAAGVIIAGRKIRELVPLYKDPRSDIPATQYNMKWAEAAGLVKFDFLGLKTLTVIQQAIKLLLDRDITLDFSSQRYDDKETFDFLTTGQTLGVFQLEGQGMRDTLRKMQPNCLDDIIALISLYRPGPMENIPTYCDVKAGRLKPDYLHESLVPVLKETQGVIIYQEQVMQIAQILSGYSLGEADMLRRAMGKKLPAEMAIQRNRFIEGALKKNIDKTLAGRIFDLVDKFAGYGFNKSHAAAYAVISYQTAYLKTKYPVEFLVAAMNLDIDITEKLGTYIQDAKRMGIPIIKPDINVSQSLFSVVDGAICYGLGALKNVGQKAMMDIVNIRNEGGKFKSIFDFFERIDPKMVNKRVIETLAKAGAFDSIELNRAKIHNAAEQLIAHSSSIYEQANNNQTSLFGDAIKLPQLPIQEAQKWDDQEKLSNEFSAIGLFLSGHPLDELQAELEKRKTIYFGNISTHLQTTEGVFRMAGVVRAYKERPAKRGGKFAWATFSDPTGEFEAFIRPEDIENARTYVKIGNTVSFVGNVKKLEGDIKITASRFDAIENIADNQINGAKIFLEDSIHIDELAKVTERLRGIASNCFGELRLILPIGDGEELEVILPGQFPLDIAARRALKTATGVAMISEY